MKCPSKVDKREKELKQGFPRTFFFQNVNSKVMKTNDFGSQN